MINRVFKTLVMYKEKFEPKTVILIFRYSTFLIISLFFLFDVTINPLPRRVFIVLCIGISALLLNYLYINKLNNTRKVFFLLAAETVFNILILIPSGGIESPYIWYSLNTIFVALIVFRRKAYCWLNLFFYLFCAIWVSDWILDKQNDIVGVLQKESNYILSLILITLALRILVEYNKKIEEKNISLKTANDNILTANKKIKEYINSIMELYQAVHVLASQQDRENLMDVILEYTAKITKSNRVFYINKNQHYGRDDFLCYPKGSSNNDEFTAKLSSAYCELCDLDSISSAIIEDQLWAICPVKRHSVVYGIIGVEMPSYKDKDEKVDISDQLTFLSELGAMALERYELEQVNKRLLINEEQNRIANEIHDGVLQKLFSISCGIFNLSKRYKIENPKRIKSGLSDIQSSINEAMRDLRSAIYGYSWKKEGANNFLMDIKNVIDSVKKYHDAVISFDLRGNIELLSVEHKKAFYRIINEGIGNAIRHGDAKHIRIELTISSDDITLTLDDDGKGFDINILQSNKIGMGIKNINLLTRSLHGNMSLASSPEKGTTITINVPSAIRIGQKESAI